MERLRALCQLSLKVLRKASETIKLTADEETLQKVLSKILLSHDICQVILDVNTCRDFEHDRSLDASANNTLVNLTV